MLVDLDHVRQLLTRQCLYMSREIMILTDATITIMCADRIGGFPKKTSLIRLSLNTNATQIGLLKQCILRSIFTAF